MAALRPSSATSSGIAKVCPVIGTGYIGMLSLAASAMSSEPHRTSSTRMPSARGTGDVRVYNIPVGASGFRVHPLRTVPCYNRARCDRSRTGHRPGLQARSDAHAVLPSPARLRGRGRHPVPHAWSQAGHRDGSGVSRLRRRQRAGHRSDPDPRARRPAAAGGAAGRGAGAGCRVFRRRTHLLFDQRLDQRQPVHDDGRAQPGRPHSAAAQLAQVGDGRTDHERRLSGLDAARSRRVAAHGSYRHAADACGRRSKSMPASLACTSFRRRTTASPPTSPGSPTSRTSMAFRCSSTRPGGRTSTFIRRCPSPRCKPAPTCASTRRTRCSGSLSQTAMLHVQGDADQARSAQGRLQTVPVDLAEPGARRFARRRPPPDGARRTGAAVAHDRDRRTIRAGGSTRSPASTASATSSKDVRACSTSTRPRSRSRSRISATPGTRPKRFCAGATTCSASWPTCSIRWRSSRSGPRSTPPTSSCTACASSPAKTGPSTSSRRRASWNAGSKPERTTCRAIPPIRLLPREAFLSPTEFVPFKKSAGRICAEVITPYPPGIPVISPGEEITREIIDVSRLGEESRREDAGPLRLRPAQRFASSSDRPSRMTAPQCRRRSSSRVVTGQPGRRYPGGLTVAAAAGFVKPT